MNSTTQTQHSTTQHGTTVSVNGEPRTVPGSSTLHTVLDDVSAGSTGVAVALNETVVPRDQWRGTALRDGDRVEVLTAVQGG